MESLNSFYTVPSSPALQDHIKTFSRNSAEAINNVYELPSIEQSIRYLHGAAGFPTKATWLRSIRNGNYLSWPLVNVKNVNKYFPESEETQKGHMRNQRQGVCSTKRSQPPNPFSLAPVDPGAVVPDLGASDLGTPLLIAAGGAAQTLNLIAGTAGGAA